MPLWLKGHPMIYGILFGWIGRIAGGHSKFLASIVGAFYGFIASKLATMIPGIASCTADTCTILGFSEAQFLALVMTIFSALWTERAPANS